MVDTPAGVAQEIPTFLFEMAVTFRRQKDAAFPFVLVVCTREHTHCWRTRYLICHFFQAGKMETRDLELDGGRGSQVLHSAAYVPPSSRESVVGFFV